MGREAANFQYKPRDQETGVDTIRSVLKALGAVSDASETAILQEECEYYALRGERHFIGLELNLYPSLVYLSFSIALCNPPEALDVLRKALTALLEVEGGLVLASSLVYERAHGAHGHEESGMVSSKRRHRFEEMDDASWEEVREAYEQHRASRRDIHGDFEAAIPAGGRVYEYMTRNGIGRQNGVCREMGVA